MSPMCEFSIESITTTRAIIFGGVVNAMYYPTNNIYVIDITNNTVVSYY